MLGEILGVIQEFERMQGARPQVICLNARHMLALMDECAERFDGRQPVPLGIRFLVVAEREAPRPTAMRLAPRMRAGGTSDADVILSWSTGRQNLG